MGVPSVIRQCSRTACAVPAVATLTYVYADSTAVLGPLAVQAEPHCYDLCHEHANTLTVPRGWEVVRLVGELSERDEPDDLVALADAVSTGSQPTVQPAAPEHVVAPRTRRLRVLPPPRH